MSHVELDPLFDGRKAVGSVGRQGGWRQEWTMMVLRRPLCDLVIELVLAQRRISMDNGGTDQEGQAGKAAPPVVEHWALSLRRHLVLRSILKLQDRLKATEALEAP